MRTSVLISGKDYGIANVRFTNRGEWEMLEKLSMILLSETRPRMVLFSIMGQIGGMFILYWMLENR